ncbi:phosphotransferase enzyme family protein [Nocardioides bizhenqiangii]|uniref:Phosphotransferase n=1 Tax=Nocardioides bizhenqiangii TaxID=3095076 RepID=A0ABZ0ZPQ6_9ACTN|nr:MULTISPECIES: phosphotransferase [unclassified Nocardioides]MDZ5621541.1 phosphotransferase [Nocardioides sp. HM23]WQQ25622.1 phosphotransferase [Nocardioides sp. HM61]
MTDPTELLERFWGVADARVSRLGGGMNSETWLVDHQGATYVAKSVSPAALADLVSGCEVAAALADAGFVTGRPVPTRDGRIACTEPPLALLERVSGRELDGETAEEQRWMARTLAGIHAASGPASGPSTAAFATDWISPQLPGVEAHPWLTTAIGAVRAETAQLKVTWSQLHTDPAPEAFIHDDSTGVTGLIDWTGARKGPVLYDVASAVMYLGGPDRATAFLDTYQSHGPLAAQEMQYLDAFRRFREAVQGAYFARRLAVNDLTGGIDQAENHKGLSDARRRIVALGPGAG